LKAQRWIDYGTWESWKTGLGSVRTGFDRGFGSVSVGPGDGVGESVSGREGQEREGVLAIKGEGKSV
jgi:hypothetical protein